MSPLFQGDTKEDLAQLNKRKKDKKTHHTFI